MLEQTKTQRGYGFGVGGKQSSNLRRHNNFTQFSEDADLVIMGLSLQKLTEDKGHFIKGFPGLNEVLFMRAGQKIVITEVDEQ